MARCIMVWTTQGSPAIDRGVSKWVEHTVYISYAMSFNPSSAKYLHRDTMQSDLTQQLGTQQQAEHAW